MWIKHYYSSIQDMDIIKIASCPAYHWVCWTQEQIITDYIVVFPLVLHPEWLIQAIGWVEFLCRILFLNIVLEQ